ncbi:MAG TPA: hypothetical protein VK171_12635 [Fimbriimonas sp.]|nr:hypothetical protein [Fimbriimonas sp.]
MRAFWVGLAVFAFAGIASADAKSDCLRALAEARKAGLPTTMAEFVGPKPSTETLLIEKLFGQIKAIKAEERPTLDELITIDLDNLARKQKGLPELPYPEDPPEIVAKRVAKIDAIYAQLAKTTAPRARAHDMVMFASIEPVKRMVDLAEEARKSGNVVLLRNRLFSCRRMIELVPQNANFVSRLRQHAAEQIYYTFVKRLLTSSPELAKQITVGILAPLKKYSFDQMLKDEFFTMVHIFTGISSTGGTKKWSLPKDSQSLKILTETSRQWTIAYKALAGSKSFAELGAKYKKIAKKMTTYKHDGDELPYGPSGNLFTAKLDRRESERLELLKSWPGQR